MNKLKKSYIH